MLRRMEGELTIGLVKFVLAQVLFFFSVSEDQEDEIVTKFDTRFC